jgi:hypothetical protein
VAPPRVRNYAACRVPRGLSSLLRRSAAALQGAPGMPADRHRTPALSSTSGWRYGSWRSAWCRHIASSYHSTSLSASLRRVCSRDSRAVSADPAGRSRRRQIREGAWCDGSVTVYAPSRMIHVLEIQEREAAPLSQHERSATGSDAPCCTRVSSRRTMKAAHAGRRRNRADTPRCQLVPVWFR